MKYISFFTVLVLTSSLLLAQEITITNIKDSGKKLFVWYDIKSSTKTKSYNIKQLKIINTESNKIYPTYSIKGDFGKNIKTGKGKIIKWNYEKDGVILDYSYNVQLIANEYYNKKRLILQSFLFPGLGTADFMDRNKFRRATIVYGSILSGGILYSLKNHSYEKSNYYLTNNYYHDYYWRKTLIYHYSSMVSLSIGFGIWAWDFLQIIVLNEQGRELSYNDLLKNEYSLSINYNSFSQSIIYGINYNF